jgi:hypothetical protein
MALNLWSELRGGAHGEPGRRGYALPLAWGVGLIQWRVIDAGDFPRFARSGGIIARPALTLSDTPTPAAERTRAARALGALQATNLSPTFPTKYRERSSEIRAFDNVNDY